jgi:hypothetical protein
MLHHEVLFHLKNFLGLSGPYGKFQSYAEAFPSFNTMCADIERDFMRKTGDIAFHYHEKHDKLGENQPKGGADDGKEDI